MAVACTHQLSPSESTSRELRRDISGGISPMRLLLAADWQGKDD